MDSVASRYAIALLSIAKEDFKVKEYVEEVEQLVTIFETNSDLVRLLKDFGLSKEDKKETLSICFKNKVNEYILNLFYVLVDNKRGGIILDVCNEFVRRGLNELNIKRGIVYSTIKLTSNQLKGMENKISKMLNANVTLRNIIDENLLGGFKIQVEDYILDDSMKTRLSKLKETITLKKGEN